METISIEQHKEEIKKVKKKGWRLFNGMSFVAVIFFAGFLWQLHSSMERETMAKDAYKKAIALLIQAEDQKHEFAKYKAEHP